MEKARTVRIEQWQDISELVAMSIGTDKGRWWADASFGSELWILQKAKVDGSTAGKVRSMILESLAWLKADRLVQEIECEAERTGKNEIRYVVTVSRPGEQSITVKDVWHGIE